MKATERSFEVVLKKVLTHFFFLLGGIWGRKKTDLETSTDSTSPAFAFKSFLLIPANTMLSNNVMANSGVKKKINKISSHGITFLFSLSLSLTRRSE